MKKNDEKNSRREFLKTTSKIGAVAAVGGLVITACNDKTTGQDNITTGGKSNKEEILYQGDTKQWREYYLTAK